MSWEFKPGMKVVCVGGPIKRGPGYPTPHGLEVGKIYEVRAICGLAKNYYADALPNDLAIFVNGASAEWLGQEWPLPGDRFRPLEEKPDTIELFRSLANDTSHPIIPGGDKWDVRETEPVEWPMSTGRLP